MSQRQTNQYKHNRKWKQIVSASLQSQLRFGSKYFAVFSNVSVESFCLFVFHTAMSRNRTFAATWLCSITCWNRCRGFLAMSSCLKTTWKNCPKMLLTERMQKVRAAKHSSSPSLSVWVTIAHCSESFFEIGCSTLVLERSDHTSNAPAPLSQITKALNSTLCLVYRVFTHPLHIPQSFITLVLLANFPHS